MIGCIYFIEYGYIAGIGMDREVITCKELFGTCKNTQELNCKISGMNHILLIDIRSHAQYQVAHIPGAVNISKENLEIKLQSMSAGSKRYDIIIYCSSGVDSIYMTSKLRRKGYRARSLLGGFSAYEKYVSNFAKTSHLFD